MVKKPIWEEADQLAIYKHNQGVASRTSVKQLQLVVKRGLGPGTSGFQVRDPNPLARLPPIYLTFIHFFYSSLRLVENCSFLW